MFRSSSSSSLRPPLHSSIRSSIRDYGSTATATVTTTMTCNGGGGGSGSVDDSAAASASAAVEYVRSSSLSDQQEEIERAAAYYNRASPSPSSSSPSPDLLYSVREEKERRRQERRLSLIPTSTSSDNDDDGYSYDTSTTHSSLRRRRSSMKGTRNRWRSPSFVLIMIGCGTIVASVLLGYLIVLGHDILDELQDHPKSSNNNNYDEYKYYYDRNSANYKDYDNYDYDYTRSSSSSHYHHHSSSSSHYDRNRPSTIRATMFADSILPPADEATSRKNVILSSSNKHHENDNSDPSSSNPYQPITVLIVYGPEDDKYQQKMANYISEGVKSVQAQTSSAINVIVKSIATASFTDDVLTADAIIVGSSVENSNVHPKVQEWMNQHWKIRDARQMEYKIGSAFVTAGGISAGQEHTLTSLLQSMLIFNMIVVGGAPTWTFPYGASAITYEYPFGGGKRSSIGLAAGGDPSCYEQFYNSYPIDEYFDGDLEQANSLVQLLHAEKDIVVVGGGADDEDNSEESFSPISIPSIHPMFLAKAYALGIRVAKVTIKTTTTAAAKI